MENSEQHYSAFFKMTLGSCGLMDNVLFLRAIHCRVKSCQDRCVCRLSESSSDNFEEHHSALFENKTLGACGLMDNVLLLRARDCRLESCQGHCVCRLPESAMCLDNSEERWRASFPKNDIRVLWPIE